MKNPETEQHVRAALARLADNRAPTQSEVMARVTDRTGSSRRTSSRNRTRSQRSAAAILVAAASVAAILVGGNLVHGARQPTVPQATSSTEPTPAAANTRVVGRGHAVINVPDTWATNAVRCGIATADTVVTDPIVSRACGAAAPSQHSYVVIGSATSHPATVGTSTQVAGLTVYTTAPHVDGGVTVIDLAVPDEDAWFHIVTRTPDLATRIAASLRILSNDQTTMPDITLGATGGRPGYSEVPDPAEVTRRLELAHLVADIRFSPGTTSDNWTRLDTDTPFGTVLSTSSTVTITYY